MDVRILLSMVDQAESGGHYSRKEIQLFVFALQRNCSWPEPSVVLPRYYRHGIVSSRYFLRITTFSIKHHKSGMPMKQGFPYVPPQARFSAFVAVKMSILLQLADTKEQINVLCAVSASSTPRDRTSCFFCHK